MFYILIKRCIVTDVGRYLSVAVGLRNGGGGASRGIYKLGVQRADLGLYTYNNSDATFGKNARE